MKTVDNSTQNGQPEERQQKKMYKKRLLFVVLYKWAIVKQIHTFPKQMAIIVNCTQVRVHKCTN